MPPLSLRFASAENPPEGGERYVIPNLRNACRILKLLGEHPEGIKAAELARSLQIPVTSTLRIMTTLHLEGLARKVDGRYELGAVMIQLGNAALTGTEIRPLAIPLLQRITAQTDETSHLALPCDDQSLIVAVEDSPHALRAASRPGFLAELHCSSTGKVFLAFIYRDRLVELMTRRRPVRRTPRTLTTLAQLKREADLTRKRGYGVDDEEFHAGVRCVAAPVFGPDGKVAGAIGVTAPTSRLAKERIPELAAKVCSTAADLSRLMGYTAPRA